MVIATDGSCLGNPGAGGWAWAVSPQVWGAGGAVHTTNNAMELQAIRQALLFAPTDMPLVIETDSAYSTQLPQQLGRRVEAQRVADEDRRTGQERRADPCRRRAADRARGVVPQSEGPLRESAERGV